MRKKERAVSGGNETRGMCGEFVGQIEEIDNSCREAVAGRKGDGCIFLVNLIFLRFSSFSFSLFDRCEKKVTIFLCWVIFFLN